MLNLFQHPFALRSRVVRQWMLTFVSMTKKVEDGI